LIVLLLGLGALLILFRRGTKTGKRLLLAGAFLYIFLGFSPLSYWLLIPLEGGVEKAASAELADAAGIIVLGGGGERMTEGARLSIHYPALPLVFSGGNPRIFQLGESESHAARRFFAKFDIAPPRLVLEDRSRNTVENAAFTAKLLQPKAGQRWVLITSAFHMPRAKALFESQGFEIVPWPVDYRTRGSEDRWRYFTAPSQGLRHMDLAFKEWAGILVLWLRGDMAWPMGKLV
jgi:uncharacterized SAM-binding protein YcdF (DUF218 family)